VSRALVVAFIALGLLRYALIFVALFPKVVSWMNKFIMDDVPSKILQYGMALTTVMY
jgi:hypothetical protein